MRLVLDDLESRFGVGGDANVIIIKQASSPALYG